MTTLLFFNTSACGLRVNHVGGPNIRFAILDDVTSGLTGNHLRSKLYTYTHSVDYLENGGKIYTSASTFSMEKMAGKSRITFIRFVM